METQELQITGSEEYQRMPTSKASGDTFMTCGFTIEAGAKKLERVKRKLSVQLCSM